MKHVHKSQLRNDCCCECWARDHRVKNHHRPSQPHMALPREGVYRNCRSHRTPPEQVF